MKFSIIAADGRMITSEAETMHRDGDWIMLTKQAPQMESRRVEKPRDPTDASAGPVMETIMVSTGRMVQLPIAYFFKPISVELVTSKEPTDGNDA